MKISIIIATYNRPEMLEARMKELEKQTFQDFEIIVVDDHSDTPVEGYLPAGASYTRLHKNTGCCTIPRNIGITQATGEYICPTDDDVGMLPNKLEMLTKALDDNPRASMAYGNRYTERDSVRELTAITSWNPYRGPGIDNGQMMYRRSCYDKIPLIFCTRACDWELAKELRKCGPFIHVPEPVSIYYWHGGNRSLDPSTKTRPIQLDEFRQLFPPQFKLKEV